MNTENFNPARESWDDFYMGLASYVATRSRDPSTHVGAVVVRPDKTTASIGFNGFPRGVSDDFSRYLDREFKLAVIVHAETNAILNAREPLHGCSIYSTFHPCARCASTIVQAGIRCVVIRDEPIPDRWKADMDIASVILEEGGVEVRKISAH